MVMPPDKAVISFLEENVKLEREIIAAQIPINRVAALHLLPILQ